MSDGRRTEQNDAAELSTNGRICSQLLHSLAIINCVTNCKHAYQIVPSNTLSLNSCGLSLDFICHPQSFVVVPSDIEVLFRNKYKMSAPSSLVAHSSLTKLPMVHPFCNCVLLQFLALNTSSFVSNGALSNRFRYKYRLRQFLSKLKVYYYNMKSSRERKEFLLHICRAQSPEVWWNRDSKLWMSTFQDLDKSVLKVLNIM